MLHVSLNDFCDPDSCQSVWSISLLQMEILPERKERISIIIRHPHIQQNTNLSQLPQMDEEILFLTLNLLLLIHYILYSYLYTTYFTLTYTLHTLLLLIHYLTIYHV